MVAACQHVTHVSQTYVTISNATHYPQPHKHYGDTLSLVYSSSWNLMQCFVGDGKERQATSDYYSITRSLGRQPRAGHSTSGLHVSSHVSGPDIIQHPAFRHLIPSVNNLGVKTRSFRQDESPINSHYTRIYSGRDRERSYGGETNVDDMSEVYREALSSDSDYDTIYSNKEDNGTLLPIGKITSEATIIRILMTI